MNFIAVFKNGQKVRIKDCEAYEFLTQGNSPGLVRVQVGNRYEFVFVNPAETLYWGNEDNFEEVNLDYPKHCSECGMDIDGFVCKRCGTYTPLKEQNTMNRVKRLTLKDRIKAAVRAFKGKPKNHLTVDLGVSVHHCSECERVELLKAVWLPSDGVKPSWMCSRCKCQAPRDWARKAMPTPYCPWCGSKMVEIKKEAEE